MTTGAPLLLGKGRLPTDEKATTCAAMKKCLHDGV